VANRRRVRSAARISPFAFCCRISRVSEYEQADSGVMAVLEWRKVFGAQFKVNYAEGPLSLQALMLASA
jgi:hypothetical protein